MRVKQMLFLAAAVLLSGCETITGSSLTRYRDVYWQPIGVDGIVTDTWMYAIDLPSYTWQPDGGGSETCDVTGHIIPYGFSWVELAESGRIVGVGPTRKEEPYEMLNIRLRSLCNGAEAATWWFNATILVEAVPLRDQGLLEIRSIGHGDMMLMNDWVDAQEAERWVDVDMNDQPLADRMHLPVDITVRAWHPDGVAQLATLTRRIVLIYERQESVTERGSP
jgi:hypothetical protein